MKDKKQTQPTETALKCTESYEDKICTDPNGSYTGVPENKKEKPVQDADDL